MVAVRATSLTPSNGVLGEQSAKSLRGDAMLDVIFNGSSARKPAGWLKSCWFLKSQTSRRYPVTQS